MSNQSPIEKKRVYFIRHPTGSLEAIEKFLKHRDFEVESASELKAAFTGIVQMQPHYVFVCLDHPSEKIAAIPKLLLQSLQLLIVPYVQMTSINSIRAIQTSRFEYKLFPPNSGPAALRLLVKIGMDQNTNNREPKKEKGQIINASKGSESETNLYRIDGVNGGPSEWNVKSGEISMTQDQILNGQDSQMEDLFNDRSDSSQDSIGNSAWNGTNSRKLLC